MRAIGLDLGSKRIGVAVSDDSGALATPYDVITRSGDRARDHRRVRELAEETGAGAVIVGLPLSLDGSIGPAARAALAEVDELRVAIALPVETYDERLTTVTADRSLQQGAGMNARARRTVIDKVAAAVMLQAWLDAASSRG
jgi:putative Holliday junction resolvase